jgi:integrase
MRIKLKGVHTVKAKGHTYYYAWRGGPRVHGKPGTPEFIASYNEAVAGRTAPDTGKFRSVVTLYKGSRDFKKNAPSTRAEWGKWLDQIAEYFGSLSIAQFDRSQKIKPIILLWRKQWADTPRTADYGMQVLSRVLASAVADGKITSNPCEGIRHLYHADRSEIIWPDADITQIKSTSSEEINYAVELAALTGLRLGDLVRVSWSHVGPHAIELTTGKSRHRRKVIIPLYADLRALLQRIPKRATTILTSSRRRPWTEDGFGSSFNKAKIDAGMAGRDLHFNDLRGTAATKFYVAGLPIRVIAEIMGWEEDDVEKIIRRYVGRTAAVKAMIAQLDKTKNEQKL